MRPLCDHRSGMGWWMEYLGVTWPGQPIAPVIQEEVRPRHMEGNREMTKWWL